MTTDDFLVSPVLTQKPRILWIAEGVHSAGETRRYRFEGLWILHLYSYRGSVKVDGTEFRILPGFASVMPPGAEARTVFAEDSRHLFAHFQLAEEGTGTPIRLMQDLGEEFVSLHAEFEQAASLARGNLLWAEVKLWDILWRLAERSARSQGDSRLHPALEKAMQRIEGRLAEPIRAAELAEEVGLSHNHLLRLFRQETGDNIMGYLQARRLERAKHLLLHTQLPMKAIAAEVGIPDPHYFNKTIRRLLGASPTEIREQGGK